MVIDYQARRLIDAQPAKLIAVNPVITARAMQDKRPDFVDLDMSRLEVLQLRRQKLRAMRPSDRQDVQDGLLGHTGQASASANADALAEQADDLRGFLCFQSRSFKRLSLGEGFAASMAVVALHDTVTVFEPAKLLGWAITAVTTFQTCLSGLSPYVDSES